MIEFYHKSKCSNINKKINYAQMKIMKMDKKILQMTLNH